METPGDAADARSTPWKGLGNPANPAMSARKVATCPLAGTVTVPVRPVALPASVVNSKLTVTGTEVELAIATPVWVEPTALARKSPDDSAYSLNAVAVRSAGTPASVTLTS